METTHRIRLNLITFDLETSNMFSRSTILRSYSKWMRSPVDRKFRNIEHSHCGGLRIASIAMERRSIAGSMG